MMRSLPAMAVLSRMVSMAPVPRLPARDFQRRQVLALVQPNQFVHVLLVTTTERFRLRVAIVSRCVAVGDIIDLKPEWEQLRAARHGLQLLSEESLETLRILLASLAADSKR
jgi:hypothetical protein